MSSCYQTLMATSSDAAYGHYFDSFNVMYAFTLYLNIIVFYIVGLLRINTRVFSYISSTVLL